MSTGNSQNAKQRLISFVQPKAWQIDLTCAIDFTPSPHQKNCLSNSPNTFSIAVKIARYLVYKM